MVNEPKPEPKDYAEILRKHFSAAQSPERSKFTLSKRNQQKLAKIRLRVKQLRGGR